MPDYIQDLIKEISESSYTPNYEKPLCKSIQSIIKGKVLIENDQLFYEDQSKTRHAIQNVATGIKSLGLLQLLVAGDAVKKNDFLVIDEPEVHLHPSWQLEYAKVVIELVKKGIRVLINSHSSYFTQALDIYSTNEGIADKTNFYLGTMTDKGSIFEDVTESLEPIYKAFAAPSLQLMLERSRGKRQRQQAPLANVAKEGTTPYKTEQDKDH